MVICYPFFEFYVLKNTSQKKKLISRTNSLNYNNKNQKVPAALYLVK